MDNLISRQAAIDAVNQYNFDFPQYMKRFVTELRDAMKADLKHDIEALPSAQPEPKWIPVSERLPETNDVYLVAINSWGCPQRAIDGFMSQTTRKWEVYGNKVIAWMPLPEPYKAERSGKE